MILALVYIAATSVFVSTVPACCQSNESTSHMCANVVGEKFMEHLICMQNNTECYIEFEIGKCLSCDPSTCDIVDGACFAGTQPSSSFKVDFKFGHIHTDHILPPKTCEDLNNRMCGAANRKGLFCGQCKPGYGLAPYSSTFKCFKCKNDGSIRLWLIYTVLELVPSTAFFLIIIFFNVRTTAPPFTSIVLFSQIFALLYKIHPLIRLNLNVEINQALLNSILTLVGFWNLDFFRYAVPPFCITSKLTDLQVLFLQLVSAFYPLVLAFLTLALIKLHSRNCRPLVALWKPFHKYCARCRRKLDPKTSVIAAFATLLTLSFSKIMVIVTQASYSAGFLPPNSHKIVTRSLYEPTIQGNTSGEYWKQLIATPFFPPLLIVLIIIQLPTFLLLVYPIRVFRRMLQCCCLRKLKTAISIFMDTFQGHYKDGTNGCRDYRAASCISFLLKTLFCFMLCTRNAREGMPSQKTSYMFFAYTLVVASLCYALFQPCKRKFMNMAESVVYCSAGLMLLSLGNGHRLASHTLNDHTLQTYMCFHVPLAVMVLPPLSLLFWLVAKVFLCLCYCSGHKYLCIKRVRERLDCAIGNSNYILLEDVPDRLQNPQNYEALN